MQTEKQILCKGPCGRTLPATTEFFPTATCNPSGIEHTCRECNSAKKRHLRSNERDELLKGFRKAGLELIEGQLKSIGDVPHSAHLVQAIYDAFGGVRGYANDLRQQYEQAEEGGYGRTRILELVARLTVQNTAVGGAKKPVELMTDEELAERRRELIVQVLSGEQKKLGLLEESTGGH